MVVGFRDHVCDLSALAISSGRPGCVREWLTPFLCTSSGSTYAGGGVGGGTQPVDRWIRLRLPGFPIQTRNRSSVSRPSVVKHGLGKGDNISLWQSENTYTPTN